MDQTVLYRMQTSFSGKKKIEQLVCAVGHSLEKHLSLGENCHGVMFGDRYQNVTFHIKI